MACLRNFWAYALFGLMWLAVLVLVVACVSTIAALLGNGSFATDLLFPALLLVATMFFTSLYFTFRDTFEPPPAIAP